MKELAVFRIPEPHAAEAAAALDQLHLDLTEWIDGAKGEAKERWGRDAILLRLDSSREVYGIEDIPYEERPSLNLMPTKEWKRLDVPDGWERLVDHRNKPDALRPRIKATRDWVNGWTKAAPPTEHQAVAQVLGIQTTCFFGLHLYSFGLPQFGEHGTFLVWPESMIKGYEESEDARDKLTNYVPEFAERVPLSEYYAAKEAFEADA